MLRLKLIHPCYLWLTKTYMAYHHKQKKHQYFKVTDDAVVVVIGLQ